MISGAQSHAEEPRSGVSKHAPSGAPLPLQRLVLLHELFGGFVELGVKVDAVGGADDLALGLVAVVHAFGALKASMI